MIVDKYRQSIQVKFIGLMFVVMLVTSMIVGATIASRQQSLLRASLQGKGRSLSDFIAMLAGDPLVAKDTLLLDSIVTEASKDSEVAYAVVTDADGNAMTSREASINARLPELAPVLQRFPGSSDVSAIGDGFRKAGIVWELASPVVVGGRTVGKVAVGVISTRIAGEIRTSVIYVFLANVLIAFLLTGGILLMATRVMILQPISKLLVFSGKIAEGDLMQRTKVTSRDEIGRLTAGLNGMADNLARTVANINDAYGSVGAIARDLTEISRQVSRVTLSQAQSIDDASSSIEQMNAIIKDVAGNVETLFIAAEETTSSILEMSSSIGEVAANAEVLSGNVENSTSLVTEMAASVTQVARNTETLSTMIAQTSSSISQIASSTRAIDENTKTMSKLADTVTAAVSQEGRAAVVGAVEGINRIRDVVATTMASIQSLGGKSQDIGSILTVINGIAEQINLLALNASIIAAQAGEHGKGFAVVADEIRGLAERTSSSTKEIDGLIKGVQQDIENASSEMGQVANSVRTGITLVENIDKTLSKVEEHSRRTSETAGAVARATAEQAKGARQISESSETIARMTVEISRAAKEQAKGTEQITRAVEAMRDLAIQLKKATIDQSKGAKQISQASENSTVMAQNLLKAAKEEAKGSEMILSSIAKIREATQVHLAAVGKLDAMVKSLTEQSERLHNEIERFTIQ